MVLLLQQVGVTHEPIRRLRERAQETRKDGPSLGRIAHIKKTVKLHSVVLCGERRLVEASVDVGKACSASWFEGASFNTDWYSVTASRSLLRSRLRRARSRCLLKSATMKMIIPFACPVEPPYSLGGLQASAVFLRRVFRLRSRQAG